MANYRKMNFTEVIDHGPIVAHDDPRGLLVTWDRSETMLVWKFDMTGNFKKTGTYLHLNSKPKRTRDAAVRARKLLKGVK
jgi:hypothetical protein